MKTVLLSFGLFLLLSVNLFSYDADAKTLLTEKQALDVLVSRIQKDKLYDSWTTLSCLSFITEEKTKDYIDFAVHEKHGGGCPGDPNTSPTVDRFRVDRLTKKLQWYITEGELLPYKAILKFRVKQ